MTFEEKIEKRRGSYATYRGKEYFDWEEFLSRSEYDPADLAYARNLAASYVTCACGTECADILRDALGKPDDEHLADLGMRFYDYITAMKFSHGTEPKRFDNAKKQAINKLGEIERRAKEIIQEMKEKEI